MTIEEKMDKILELLDHIESGILDMVNTMDKMGEMIQKWRSEDLDHHEEENDLLKRNLGENNAKKEN